MKTMKDHTQLTFKGDLSQSDSMSHYGRLGMKWGQRIFSKDTSGGSGKPSTGLKAKPKKKSIKDLTDEELQKKIARLQMEETYAGLVSRSNERSKGRLAKGSKIVGDMVATSGKSIAQQMITKVMAQATNKAIRAAANRRGIPTP